MKSTSISPEDLAALRQVDTPTVCNVIETFDRQPRESGYMDHRIKACFPEMPPSVGFACTAAFRGAMRLDVPEGYAAIEQQVARLQEMAVPAIMVFQDLDDPAVAATFGEIMCTAYQKFGAVGLITSGAARDLAQVRRINFPVFSRSVICSHGHSQIVDLDTVVRVGGLDVRPGDLLHADCNGVTRIPLEIASRVAQACAEYIAAEEVILSYLKQDTVSLAGFSTARKAGMDRIKAMYERNRKP